MRLIDTQTLKLKDFGVDPPPYAILSHTWGKEEVTFQDMADLDAARKKKGFSKIEQCCRQARQDGFDWTWVDTCCIDKTSSAELSETINSMFSWYERAMKCYAILNDVVATRDELFPPPGQDAPNNSQRRPSWMYPHHKSAFFDSRWWTRGWTLQELIAPHDVEFYNRDWEYLTSKRACKDLIGEACAIAVPVLDQSRALASFCVAERISWASHRETTRDEDMAYCLLGLLDVNMPLLYGEGGYKAFLRLQQHFLEAKEDWTIFLWGERFLPPAVHVAGPFCHSPAAYLPPSGSAPVASMSRAPIHNILASSPSFLRRPTLSEWPRWSGADQKLLGFGEPPQATSRGLRLSLYLRRVTTQDLDGASQGASQLSRSLNDCFHGLHVQDPHFTYWLRPRSGELAQPLFFAAFPISNADPDPLLPCVLLLSTDSFGPAPTASKLLAGITSRGPRTYVRLLYFFYEIPASELSDEAWSLTTCCIQNQTESEGCQSQQPRHYTPRHSTGYGANFWVWRTPRPAIPCKRIASRFRGHDELGARHSLHLNATETFPGCLIQVAVRVRYYWLDVQVGKLRVKLKTQAARFSKMDLSSMWVETARETGPVCEERVDFGTKSLLITLWIKQSNDSLAKDWYKVYLAIVERKS